MKKIIVVMIILALSACVTENLQNLNLYDRHTYKNTTIYCNHDFNYDDYQTIYENLKTYITNKLDLPIADKNVVIAILPLDNTIVNWKKRPSSAYCQVENQAIFLMDFVNLPQFIYKQYGDAPKDIYLTSYIHELAHCMTMPTIQFSINLNAQERFANFCSFIDFRSSKFNRFETNHDVLYNIKNSFTPDKIKGISEYGIGKIDCQASLDFSIFLLYLHEMNEYSKLKHALLAKDFDDFIRIANWKTKDTNQFINWVQSNLIPNSNQHPQTKETNE